MSPRLIELETAKAWGMTPGAFRALDDEEQLEMIAADRATAMMRSFEANRKK